jgi:hypothetical protein
VSCEDWVGLVGGLDISLFFGEEVQGLCLCFWVDGLIDGWRNGWFCESKKGC